ncbi:MAG TPA: hypothetical protein VME19_20790 [Streptosporangiaceae bacterium]|nr:hypothetical protein [Streptosporangiaceae bacterium]
MRQSISSWRGVHAGYCQAWPLPADATCASVARQVFRDAVSEVGLDPGLLDDCILMASELAANTLHAQAVAGVGGGGNRLAFVTTDVEGEPGISADPAPPYQRGAPTPLAVASPGGPELWLYLRGLGVRRELVCKVFDCVRGWRHGAPPSPASASTHAVTGRGLQIVHELSSGRWGHHPTRARLSGWGRRGKAVWFAVPAPLAHARLADATGLRAYTLSADVTATRVSERLSARQAARELEAMLSERGFRRLLRADQPTSDMSVLSVGHGLTIWCRSGVVSLTTPSGSGLRWNYADLVEAAEQTVRYCEELEFGGEFGLGEDLLARAQ